MGAVLLWVNEANGRWFLARRGRDLFGTEGVMLSWGGPRRRSAALRWVALDGDAYAEFVSKLDRRRRRRGYEVIE